MPSDFQLKGMNAIHRALMKISGGRLGHSAMGMPVLELHTVGRKSGRPRASMLTSPVQVDGNYVIVASKGGEPTHPGWYHNLTANPDVEFVVRGFAHRCARGR
jgi:deazaflavin-dependent oxidoreductase (nitroreductase family)